MTGAIKRDPRAHMAVALGDGLGANPGVPSVDLGFSVYFLYRKCMQFQKFIS